MLMSFLLSLTYFSCGIISVTAIGGMKNRREKQQGLGRFAFKIDNHLNEESPLIGTEGARVHARRTMFRQWGYFWEVHDKTKPVLLEKSPSNMIISRFLQVETPPMLSSPHFNCSHESI